MGGKDKYQLIKQYADFNNLRFRVSWSLPNESGNSYFSIQCGKFKISKLCSSGEERNEVMRSVSEHLWHCITSNKHNINNLINMKTEWLDWGKKILLPKYSNPIINDEEFLKNPPNSLIVAFESNHGEKPFMVIFLDPGTKNIYIYPYSYHEAQIVDILKNKDINKAVFTQRYIESVLGIKMYNTRDLQIDIEKIWEQPYINFSAILSDLYGRNFSFIKQHHRYVENGVDNWSPNVISTGAIQVISLYELVLKLHNKESPKKRKINK